MSESTIEFWARLEKNVDWFGVYPRDFSIHSTVGRKVLLGKGMFGPNCIPFAKIVFWNEPQGIFRRSGFGIEGTNYFVDIVPK